MTTLNMALIIGGSSGMGLATVKQLVAQGTSVIILGNIIGQRRNGTRSPVDSLLS